ncbi:MAG TPA: OmpA family protein [Minicystis sp.]|nr:OmpA family protein [Minicystis sp.]
MHATKTILALTVLGAAAVGCGSDPKPPQTAEAARNTDAAPKQAPREDTKTPTSGSIQIDDEIVKLCGNIPTAHFAFDSASIAGDAAKSLDPLAACFTTGPAKGRSMVLTGHTDPRGETEYNFALGQKRAGSVSDYLAKKGMAKSQLQPTSKGELEATGTDEEGWARDRKVVITLGK